MPLPDRIPGAFDNNIGSLEAGINIAAFKCEFMGDVARRVVMHQRRAGRHCLVQRKYRRQYFVFDDDPVYRGARGFCIDGGDCGDFVTDVTYAADGQRIKVGTEGAPFAFRGVLAGDHGLDAGHGACGAGVDREDFCVCVRAAQHRRVQHAGQMHVGDILCGAGDFRNRIGARYILADDKQTGFELGIPELLFHDLPAFFSSAAASR